MEQYIPKSALVAEIERLVDKGKYHEEFDCAYRDGNNGALYALKDKLDTLEMKEVDLEKELDSMITPELKFHKALPSLFDVAKHFFELGMQQSKNYNNNEE